ncbi:MAG: ATP-binding cassette domain-containing protein [Bradyrhizobium sp.]|jgi:ATP-binding cassette subfamily C protein|uniref:ATP-binding cassette domain-containing protein n=1 Tax=Bradyrhizobium denitrificans TaxID=2734912 RepID=A0ABS5GAZ0_9BRAD|nr:MULTISPECIES: ATP-binding cassette domain-containing protein [Bradyrhizobium]MDU7184791.1 ATP-binding cassette domain-containing protein [Klebsiella sp.]MBR1138495.1 ATP-binding cassette domain-containing protein [Bradyrhizobium denitrificans]MDU1497312.1 ATP-binding cassette domain-containing protein [Bradyrhizobium sp.]MDU1547447.1 ATP-binding cassette domain-containing protein [Bradyrhizobium sp.]MDU1688624.1 ATP-binding cassette domain-containing protein [Bradyrhizobium sp.]
MPYFRAVFEQHRQQAESNRQSRREELNTKSQPRFKLAIGLVAGLSCLRGLLNLGVPLVIASIYEVSRKTQSLHLLLELFGTIIVIHLCQATLRFIRLRVIRRLAIDVDQRYRELALPHIVVIDAPRRSENVSMRDIETIRTFLLGNGFVSLFDTPWVLIYFAVLVRINIWLGVLSALFTALVAGFGIVQQYNLARLRNAALQRTKPAINNPGDLLSRAFVPWSHIQRTLIDDHCESQRIRWNDSLPDDALNALSRSFKSVYVVAVLGLASYLMMAHDASVGTMMIAAFLAPRIVDPVDTLIKSWRDIKGARSAWPRLRSAGRVSTPSPVGYPGMGRPVLQADDLTIETPGTRITILQGVSFRLKAGEALMVVGRTGAGKTVFANTLAGCLPTRRRSISFGGVFLEDIARDQRVECIGYVPQRIEFYHGTLADNIARFNPEPDLDAVETALADIGLSELAPLAGTNIDQVTGSASPGVLKRLAIARAFYKAPPYLLLDDPEAGLDEEALTQLSELIARHRQRGGICLLFSTGIRFSHPTPRVLGEETSTHHALLLFPWKRLQIDADDPQLPMIRTKLTSRFKRQMKTAVDQ